MVFAHRGAAGQAPENTMAAFLLAARQGADGFELDVQLSRDGVPVVIHDERVDRTTDGRGWVRDLTWAELERLDAGSWRGAEFAGQGVPRLSDVLDLATKEGLWLNIELKDSVIRYPGLGAECIRLVRERGDPGRTILSTFNRNSLGLCRRLAPEIATGLLYSLPIRAPWQKARQLGAEAVHPERHWVSSRLARKCREWGIKIRPWTVDQPAQIRRLAALGVEAIITNYPERAVNTLKEEYEDEV